MIEVKSIEFGYPDRPVLFTGFSWQVAAGQAWSVLGASGCGKSTLLYLLAGLRFPVRGEILVGGVLLKRPRPGTGLILQDYGLLPWATLRENVMLGSKIRRFYGPDGRHAPRSSSTSPADVEVQQWMERLDLLRVADQFPGQVSGGQRQRAAIARTLSLEPDLLLMDEPFASLDAPSRESLQKLVLQFRQERGLTTIIVTHSIEEAVVLGENILILGKPPISRVRVIENPAFIQGAVADPAGYFEMCNQLRSELDLA